MQRYVLPVGARFPQASCACWSPRSRRRTPGEDLQISVARSIVFETVLDSGPTKSNPTIVGHSWGSPRFPIFCPNHWPDQPDRHLRLPLGEEPKTGLLREKRCCVRSEQSKMTESTGEDGEPEMGGRKNTLRRSTSRTKTRERRHKPTITVSASNPPGFTLSCALRLALVLMLIRRCFPDPSLSRSSSFQHFRALLLHRHPVNF